MSASAAPATTFTATVMGHLARSGGSDISDILIAKHDGQLQSMLDVFGDRTCGGIREVSLVKTVLQSKSSLSATKYMYVYTSTAFILPVGG
jgi:hypothetical protein